MYGERLRNRKSIETRSSCAYTHKKKQTLDLHTHPHYPSLPLLSLSSSLFVCVCVSVCIQVSMCLFPLLSYLFCLFVVFFFRQCWNPWPSLSLPYCLPSSPPFSPSLDAFHRCANTGTFCYALRCCTSCFSFLCVCVCACSLTLSPPSLPSPVDVVVKHEWPLLHTLLQMLMRVHGKPLGRCVGVEARILETFRGIYGH